MANTELLREIVRRFDTLTLQGMKNWETALGMEQLMLQLLQNLTKEEKEENAQNPAGE